MACPTGWAVTHLLVLFVCLQPVFRTFSGVTGDRRVWVQSKTCSLQDLIDGMGVLVQPPCRKLVYWLTKEAEIGRGVAESLVPGCRPAKHFYLYKFL